MTPSYQPKTTQSSTTPRRTCRIPPPKTPPAPHPTSPASGAEPDGTAQPCPSSRNAKAPAPVALGRSTSPHSSLHQSSKPPTARIVDDPPAPNADETRRRDTRRPGRSGARHNTRQPKLPLPTPRPRSQALPRIIITTEPSTTGKPAVLLTERIAPSYLDSDHFAARLIERVGWAVVDATDVEETAIRSRSGAAPN